MTDKKNFVFSTTPTQFKENMVETEAYQLHNPTTPFIGNKVFKSGAKSGQETPKYRKWAKENMNKPDFQKPNVVGGKISTVKLGVSKDVANFKDNRVLNQKQN